MTRVVITVAALAAAAVGSAQVRPDPLTQAIADGCRRDQNLIVKHEAPNWAYVNDRDHPASGPAPPPQWARGTVDSRFEPYMAVHPTGVDQPATHTAYDVNINLRLEPASEFLLGGSPEQQTGNFAGRDEESGRLHTEWQQDAFPLWAWPERGDRVEMLGSWVWDCDHFQGGEHTELHPFRAIWVQRNPGGSSPRSPFGEAEADLLISTHKTPAGSQADCGHRTKGDAVAFKACLASDSDRQDVDGSYRFFLPAPRATPRGVRPVVRIVDRGTSRGIRVRVSLLGARTPSSAKKTVATVSVDVAAPPGRHAVVAKQIFVGWRPLPARALPEHLRLTFRRLVIRRAMDPGCPAGTTQCATPETTQGAQTTRAPGEWSLYWDVAGMWSMWQPVILRTRSGRSYPGRQSVDFYVAPGRPWRLFMYGRECDFGIFNARGPGRVTPCPASGELGHPVGDDKVGPLIAAFRSPAASLGRRRAHSLITNSTCPRVNRRGCYAIVFDVRRIPDRARRAAARREALARRLAG